MSIDLTNERDVVEDFIGEIPFNVLVLADYNFYTLVDEIKNAFNTKKSPTMSITLSVFLLLILFPPPPAQQILQDVNKTPLFLITYAMQLITNLALPPQDSSQPTIPQSIEVFIAYIIFGLVLSIIIYYKVN